MSVAVLKGRNHYLSLRRWQRFLATPDDVGHEPDIVSIRFKLKILAWLATTTTGDRSEIYLAGDEEQLWRRVASDVTDCLGPACANWPNARCHMVGARRRAADAAIVVTNHALLLAGTERQGQVLGPYEALVIDEAHQLEPVATEQLGVSVRLADLTLILDRLPALPGTPLGDGSRALPRSGAATVRRCQGIHVREARWRARSQRACRSLRCDPRRSGLRVRRALRRARRGRPAARREHAGVATPDGMQTALLPQPDRADDELEYAAMALAGLAAAIDHVIVSRREGMVSWIEMRGEQAELHEAPVDVSIPLAETVFDPAELVVLTSATLSVAGGFDFIRHRVGIGATAEELTLPSPFDYLRQAVCILPEDATAYDDPVHDAHMAALIDGIAAQLDGHTLVLFTSYGPLKRVWALLQDRLDARGIASLAQGLDGTRRQILQSFLADPRTVLLATSSFWEGVDIPGDRLRCVVIDKLPFPVPTDPLVRARSEQLRDPFGEYILPVAIIRLRQGFGRLIRSASDRGAVVLCDPRLRTRQYGVGFLRALPPAPMVDDRAGSGSGDGRRFRELGDIARDHGRISAMVLERSRTGVSHGRACAAGARLSRRRRGPATHRRPRGVGDHRARAVLSAPRRCRCESRGAPARSSLTPAAAGAGLVVFPELSLTGYFLKDQVPDVALTLDSPEVQRAARRIADGRRSTSSPA